MYKYDRNLALAAYRAKHPNQLDPKEATLVDFDNDLFDLYEAEMQKQASDWGIKLDLFNRSMLAFFANASPSKTPKTRVRHACDYFDSVRPQRQPSTLGVASDDDEEL